MTWRDAPTKSIDVSGTKFAYRELGPGSGIPVIFLNHLAAELDRWDPRVVDGIAAKRRVIVFDNRGIGGSEGSVPNPSRQWRGTRSPSSARLASNRSTYSASHWAVSSRR